MTTERIEAYWKVKYDTQDDGTKYVKDCICSNCNKRDKLEMDVSSKIGFGMIYCNPSNYCPYCGCRMIMKVNA